MHASSMNNGMSLVIQRLRPFRAWVCKLYKQPEQWRAFSSTPIPTSGHNRWSKIRHDKGANDAVKSRERSNISKAITAAVKSSGPDTAFNPQLAQLISLAKKTGASKTVIENAILQGQGKSVSGAALEPFLIEAMLPGKVSCVIDCLTDNKNRTFNDLRHRITKWGGQLTGTAFVFDKKGRVIFEPKEGVGLDEVLEPAIEAGAVDVTISSDSDIAFESPSDLTNPTTISSDFEKPSATSSPSEIIVDTEPSDVQAVAKSLSSQFNLTVRSAEIIFDPKEDLMVDSPPDGSAEDNKLTKILELVRDDTSVQEIYLNMR